MTNDVVGGRAEADVDDSEALILETARELVTECGEGGFRISDLVERSGRSVGSIYHFFGSREGVLEAVWLSELTRAWAVDADRLRALAGTVQTPADLEQMVVLLAHELHDPARSDQLWAKLEVIAASRRRPALRRVVEQAQKEMTDAYTDLLRQLQDRGLLANEVDPAAVAVLVQAVTIGRIVNDLSGSASCRFDAWLEVLRRTVVTSVSPVACSS
ncbi:MAG: TetR/AcrR family transcriptional regulator [Actinomycetes bacterium]